MSDQASWQGDGLQPASGQMIDAPDIAVRTQPVRTQPAREVTADSFKNLLLRLKSGPIQQSVVVPALPTVPTPPVVAVVPAITISVPEVQPLPLVPPIIVAPPILQSVEAIVAPPPPPPDVIPEVVALEAARPVEPVKPEVPEAIAERPAPTQQERKPLVDPELEFVMRLIASVPSSEDRLHFVTEVIALEAAEKINQQPEGELAALEDELIRQTQSQAAVDLAADPQRAHLAEIAPALLQKQEQLSKAPERAEDIAATHLVGMDEAEASELARSLLDMMASSSSSGLPHERALAADTLLRLVPRLPKKPLIILADRLSIMDAPPHLLIAKLIRDPRIEVSGPLLENSSHITEQDLAQAIAEGIPAKRRLIARRRRVSREIGDQLIATRDASVQLTLVRNAAAEISHSGFLQLSEAAETAHDLLAPLCTRADLPAPFAFELFWVAPVQLRRYLLSRFLTDSETLTKILKITLATQGGEDTAATAFPDKSEVVDAINLFLAGQVQQGSEKLGTLAKVNAATVSRILSDELGDPFVILLKAIGCQRNEFIQHVDALGKSEFVSLSPGGRLDELQTLFDTMSFNKARILLTYWDWAVLKTGPYAPLH